MSKKKAATTSGVSATDEPSATPTEMVGTKLTAEEIAAIPKPDPRPRARKKGDPAAAGVTTLADLA